MSAPVDPAFLVRRIRVLASGGSAPAFAVRH